MGKRFIDTELDKKLWFKNSPQDIQLAYQYICRACDSAGLWNIELDILAIRTKSNIKINDLLLHFNEGSERLRKIGNDKLWLVGFCKFQYGKLNPSSPPHRGPISRLKSLNMFEDYVLTLDESDRVTVRVLNGVTVTPQEEEGDKDKGKEEDKEGESNSDFVKNLIKSKISPVVVTA